MNTPMTDHYEVVIDHRPMGEMLVSDVVGREKCIASLANVNRTFRVSVFQRRGDHTLSDVTEEILAMAWPDKA